VTPRDVSLPLTAKCVPKKKKNYNPVSVGFPSVYFTVLCYAKEIYFPLDADV